MNTEESKDSFLYLNIDFDKSIILDKNLIAIYCVFWIKDNEARYMANMGGAYSPAAQLHQIISIIKKVVP